jgi:hypothetical protein
VSSAGWFSPGAPLIYNKDKEKTAFTMPSGHYEFNRMGYGLCNSGASFQRLMDVVLKNLTGTECWIIIDDVIIYSRTAEEDAQRLANVLARFERANLQLQSEKCVFAQGQVQYLEHIMPGEGIHPCPEKVKAVQNYPVPKSIKEIRSFLVLGSFYRKLIHRFAEIAKTLTELTQKGEEFMWTPLRQKHFDELKNKLTTAPVLAYPDLKVPFI